MKRNVIGIVLMSLIAGGITLKTMYDNGTSEIVYANEQEVELVEKVILVRAETTEERITRKINEVFPDEPIFVDIVRCESNFRPKVNGYYDPDDCGLLQINQRYHGDAMDELGLDCHDEDDNLVFGRILYEQSGLLPWTASAEVCWMK